MKEKEREKKKEKKKEDQKVYNYSRTLDHTCYGIDRSNRLIKLRYREIEQHN